MSILELFSDKQLMECLASEGGTENEMGGLLIKGRNLALHGGSLDQGMLEAIGHLLEEGPPKILEMTALVLGGLAERYAQARNVVYELARSSHVQGRLGAILSLPPAAEIAWIDSVISVLLMDKAKKIREMAVDWISRNQKVEFLPLLKTALEKEKNEPLKAFMEREIGLLQFGYVVDRKGQSVYLTLLTSEGSRVGRPISYPEAHSLSDKEVFDRFGQLQ